MPKPKTPVRNKEQIIADMTRAKKVREQREFVKDKFYPVVLKASLNIDDAKFLLGSFSNMIMEQFLALMKEKKFGELKLEEKLDSKSPKYEEYKEMIALFKDEDIMTARELIEGMKNEISMFIDTELRERDLSTLKTAFYE